MTAGDLTMIRLVSLLGCLDEDTVFRHVSSAEGEVFSETSSETRM